LRRCGWSLQKGKAKVTVVSEQGKEAVVAILGTNEFFGEGCLAGQAKRIATIMTMTESVIARLEKAAILRVIHQEPAFAELFISSELRAAYLFEVTEIQVTMQVTNKHDESKAALASTAEAMDAGAPAEIEVTAEMIAAGEDVLLSELGGALHIGTLTNWPLRSIWPWKSVIGKGLVNSESKFSKIKRSVPAPSELCQNIFFGRFFSSDVTKCDKRHNYCFIRPALIGP
jgi:Cyclic nucleotide-binding domain